jgi:hypothetical protein
MMGRRCGCRETGKEMAVQGSMFIGVWDSYMYYIGEAGGILDQAEWLLTIRWDGKSARAWI